MAPRILEPRMTRKPPFTVDTPGSKPAEGEAVPRRNARCPDRLTTQPDPEISTVFDIVLQGAKRWGTNEAVGVRKLIRTHEEVKKIKSTIDGEETEVEKKWTYYELGPYTYCSYNEYAALVLQVGAGLRKLDINPGDKVHLFAQTTPNWLSMAHGCMSQSIPIVTAYDTLGEAGVDYTIQSTKPKAIYTDPHLLRTVMKSVENTKEIKVVIYNNDGQTELKQEDIDVLKAASGQLVIVSFEELRRLGADNPIEPVAPAASDLACIMFTSGSTGPPKGVPLLHSAVVAALSGAYTILGDIVDHSERVLAYLPLAHIFEFVVENLVLYIGGTLGYGSPRTLSDTSVRGCAGDIREFRPTILVGVPQVWESVKKGLLTRVEQAGAISRTLFWAGYHLKSFLVDRGLPGAGIIDNIVFKAAREATGGRLRFCFNGSSALSEDTLKFISMVITPMVNGYGLTETTAMGAILDPQAYASDAHGEPPSCIEVKLCSIPELSYFTDRNPPQGEILIRGPAVMKGYYNNPEETAKALDEEGWFYTGDIGEWDKNGHLRVIDRKKNLVKMLGGEYVALEKLESIYRATPSVQNACIFASSQHQRPIAIIIPSEPALKSLAQALNVPDSDALHNKDVRARILKELQATGRKAGLSSMEIVSGVVAVDDEWTPANGLVTATQKLNRRALSDRYRKEIEECFGQNP